MVTCNAYLVGQIDDLELRASPIYPDGGSIDPFHRGGRRTIRLMVVSRLVQVRAMAGPSGPITLRTYLVHRGLWCAGAFSRLV